MHVVNTMCALESIHLLIFPCCGAYVFKIVIENIIYLLSVQCLLSEFLPMPRRLCFSCSLLVGLSVSK